MVATLHQCWLNCLGLEESAQGGKCESGDCQIELFPPPLRPIICRSLPPHVFHLKIRRKPGKGGDEREARSRRACALSVYHLKVISRRVNENSLVWAGVLLMLDASMCLCGCVCDIETIKQTRRRRRKVATETDRKKEKRISPLFLFSVCFQTARQVDRDGASDSLKVSAGASRTSEGETRHVALPPFPLKTHLLLTDEKTQCFSHLDLDLL